MYKAVAMTIRDILTEKRGDFKKQVNEEGAKRVYYMCMEFLLGRSLKTNINNLGLGEEYQKALDKLGCVTFSLPAVKLRKLPLKLGGTDAVLVCKVLL